MPLLYFDCISCHTCVLCCCLQATPWNFYVINIADKLCLASSMHSYNYVTLARHWGPCRTVKSTDSQTMQIKLLLHFSSISSVFLLYFYSTSIILLLYLHLPLLYYLPVLWPGQVMIACTVYEVHVTFSQH